MLWWIEPEIWVRTRLLKLAAGFLSWFSKLNCLIVCLSTELLSKNTQPPFSLYSILAARAELLKISSQPQTSPSQFWEGSWLINKNNSRAICVLLISLLRTPWVSYGDPFHEWTCAGDGGSASFASLSFQIRRRMRNVIYASSVVQLKPLLNIQPH